jgi:hypothetical protein
VRNVIVSSRKQKSSATVSVADGAGGLRLVVDHRFDADGWPISVSIRAADAEKWMAYLDAELTARGWSSSGIGQIDVQENSGSLTVQLGLGQASSAIDVVWEKTRGGDLNIRARPGGDPTASLELVHELFAKVADRLRTGLTDLEHRRTWLVYDGLAWNGEIWLTDALRLGPPSRFPDSLFGPQVVIVDAIVEGIGSHGLSAKFQQMLREIRLFLSPVLGLHVRNVQSELDWVPDINERNEYVDCRLRPIGYVEIGAPPEFPMRGSAPPITLETVARPGLGRRGIWLGEDRAQRIPHDIEELWRSFVGLPDLLKQQFLNACNAYDIAQSLWPAHQTAYATFLVVACEALKPAGKGHEKANMYDVVRSLIDAPTAQTLRGLRPAPQGVRNQHLHRGALAVDEIAPLLFGDPFQDPSFREMIAALSPLTRVCLIEWLRRGGKYKVSGLTRSEAPRNARAARPKRPPLRKR